MRGRTAIILGATGGFGSASVRILGEDAWNIIAVARNAERLDAIKRSGFNVRTVELDLRLPDAISHLSKAAPEADLIILAAAETKFAPFCDLSREMVEQDLASNLSCFVALLQHYLPSMRANQSGAVLVMSSTAALRPAPGIALYAAAKNFMLSLSRSLAAELRTEGVTVTCCVAGPMDTDFASRAGYPRSGRGTSPDYVARKAIEACLAGKPLIYSDWNAMWRAFLYRNLPDWLFARLWRVGARRA